MTSICKHDQILPRSTALGVGRAWPSWRKHRASERNFTSRYEDRHRAP